MHCHWITCPGKSREKNFYFRVRRQFNLDAVPEYQELHIAAESYYRRGRNIRPDFYLLAKPRACLTCAEIISVVVDLTTGINSCAFFKASF